jgi:hypothetical protein
MSTPLAKVTLNLRKDYDPPGLLASGRVVLLTAILACDILIAVESG